MAADSYPPDGALGARLKSLAWALRSLGRHRLRTALSLAGIAVASAMLLDMVMLSGGLDRSFSDLLLGRGYQIRITPKGTLPFDAEATLPGAGALVRAVQADSAVEAVGPVLGVALFGRRPVTGGGDSLVTLFGYGIAPTAQAIYELEQGTDLTSGDSSGVLMSGPAAEVLGARVGDTLRLVGRLDPQMATPSVERALLVRGIVHFLYDYRGQRSVAATLPLMQQLGRVAKEDGASLLAVKVRHDEAVTATVTRLRARFPRLEISSVADLVAGFRDRMVYFRQLSYILGSMSLVVTVLLIGTLLTITVNERLGEVASLRAIGISRRTIVEQVLAEGAILTVLGSALGIVLGLLTARRLDAILTSFPGLPAAFSFFVPRLDALATAAVVLLVTGSLAGLYPAWLAARAPIATTLRAEAT